MYDFRFDYLYPSYRLAAGKHLTACKKIIANYQDVDIPKYICWEIYYLSGYIIEGCGIYAIYKNSDWQEDIKIDEKYGCHKYDEIGEMIKVFEEDTGFCFNQDTRYNIGKKLKFIQGHRIKNYKEYLAINFHDLPYLGGGAICEEEIVNLLDKWHPDFRYVTPSDDQQITSDTIKVLIRVCSDIFNYVNTLI